MDALARIVKHTLARDGAAAKVAGMTLVELVVAFGRFDLLAWLLEQGLAVDGVDRHGRTGLFLVRHVDGARALLERGASVHHVDRVGNSPLHAAVRAGRVDVVRELLAAGADPKAPNRRGLTPLHIAAQHGKTDVLAQLLAEGVDPNARDRRGRPPLMAAVVGGHLACAQRLVEAGVVLTATDHAGNGWRDLVRAGQRRALVACVLGTQGATSADDWAPAIDGGARLGQRLEAPRRAWRPANWAPDFGI